MDWFEALQNVNYLAVVVATLSTFVVGSTWYSKALFGKTWMKEIGITEKEAQDGAAKSMVASGVSTLIKVSAVAALMLATSTTGLVDGAIFGGIIGFAISGMTIVMHDAFSKRSMTLTNINVAHDVVQMIVVGAIIGAWA